MIVISLIIGILSTSIFIYPRGSNGEELTDDYLVVEHIKIDFLLDINWRTFAVAIISLTAMIIMHNEIEFRYSLIIAIFILISVWDLRFKLVPDTPIAIMAIISILIIADMEDFQLLVSRLALGISTIIIMIVVAYMTDGKIGGGDIKLFAMMAITLGLDKLFLAFYLSFLIGLIVVLPFYLIKKIKVFALVPYIAISYFIVLLLGEDIIFWYISGGLARLF